MPSLRPDNVGTVSLPREIERQAAIALGQSDVAIFVVDGRQVVPSPISFFLHKPQKHLRRILIHVCVSKWPHCTKLSWWLPAS